MESPIGQSVRQPQDLLSTTLCLPLEGNGCKWARWKHRSGVCQGCSAPCSFHTQEPFFQNHAGASIKAEAMAKGGPGEKVKSSLVQLEPLLSCRNEVNYSSELKRTGR